MIKKVVNVAIILLTFDLKVNRFFFFATKIVEVNVLFFYLRSLKSTKSIEFKRKTPELNVSDGSGL